MPYKKTNSVHRFCTLVLAALLALAGAGCGGGGAGGGAPAAESLAAARERAAAAAEAAREAHEAARMAIEGARANRTADPDSYARAALRADDAGAAWEAAKAADLKAREATSADDARRQADIAEAEEAKAERAYAEAKKYADMVREAGDAAARRTKNARLFESANGVGAATPTAARARVGEVAALTGEAGGTGVIQGTAWDLTATSDDDATTETQGTSLSSEASASTIANANWGVDDQGGELAGPRLRVRIGTGVGTSTVLDTKKAAGSVPTNERRLLPRVGAWTGFQGVELSAIEGGLYAHAYTDIAQTRTIPAQNAASVRSVPVLLAMIPESVIVSADDQAVGSFAGDYDHDGDPDTDPLEGTFSCPEGRACSLDTDGEGRIVAISGYTFTGSGPARPAREAPDEDYLVFGVWLNSPALLPSAGAFVSGNSPFEAGVDGATLRALEGTATWQGPATGIHAESGAIRPFDATATLSADFGEAASFGKISGIIGDIVSGGEPVPDSIVLIEALLDAYADTGYFQGAARMGEVEDPAAAVPTYPYNGRWGGRLYGPGAMGSGHPGSVAGVFGVSGGEGSDRQSFVGAFGAHRQ